MFSLAIFSVVLFVSASGLISEPKFRVLTPDELMVEVPHYDDMELVTFRIGVRRKDNELEDLELGENDMNNNRIFIYDERLDLKKDDVVNYLLAFKDKEGYQAQTGKYVFDGVYFKKNFGRRHRFQRSLSSTTEKSEPSSSEEDTEDTELGIGSRFGHHGHHPRRPASNNGFGPFWPPGYNPQFPGRGPPNFYPGGGPPRYPNYPQPGGGPFFPNYPQPQPGDDCNDHRHDMCHDRDVERWEKSTKSSRDYHCKMCHKNDVGRQEVSTRKVASLTTEFPDIDIRFSDN